MVRRVTIGGVQLTELSNRLGEKGFAMRRLITIFLSALTVLLLSGASSTLTPTAGASEGV